MIILEVVFVTFCAGVVVICGIGRLIDRRERKRLDGHVKHLQELNRGPKEDS